MFGRRLGWLLMRLQALSGLAFIEGGTIRRPQRATAGHLQALSGLAFIEGLKHSCRWWWCRTLQALSGLAFIEGSLSRTL